MKIYISGPITGTEGYRARFDAAERRLKKEGHKVVNPARVNAALPEGTTHKEYMSVSIAMLDMCEIIFMLKECDCTAFCNRLCEVFASKLEAKEQNKLFFPFKL